MTQFCFLISMIISSVTHELFRIMLLFPDLQGLGGMFVNDFSRVHISEWFHLRGDGGLLGACCPQLPLQAKGWQDWLQEADKAHTQQGKGRRGVGGAPAAPATRIPGNYLHSLPGHSSIVLFLEPPFLVPKIASNNMVSHLTFGHLPWRRSDKRTWKAS